jgi:3-methylfumaryl-CoA hydratase
VFVTVGHEIAVEGVPAIGEEHDIVYRGGAPGRGDPAVAPAGVATVADPLWTRVLTPDPVLLFRYSALTFNGHRIHYDRKYVTEVEGYPGLIVHGPMVATMLLDLLRHKLPDAELASYEFRAVRPVFDINHFFVCGEPQADGKTFRLWAKDHEGWLTMEATAVIK